MSRMIGLIPGAVAVLGLGACARAATGPGEPPPAQAALVAVAPTGGDTGVSVRDSVMIRFSGAMMPGMAAYMTLHAGSVTDPVVPCATRWSADSTTLILMPMDSLASGAPYTLHVGGGMRDAGGDSVDVSPGTRMGGTWATGSMMGGGMMGGSEMGSGWSGANGMYGMVFSFTTS